MKDRDCFRAGNEISVRNYFIIVFVDVLACILGH